MSGIKRPAIVRLIKYALVGGSTTLLDLVAVWVMTEYLGVPFYVSVAIGFLIGSTPNYFIARVFVFKGTTRRIQHGYVYYVTAAVLAVLAVTGSTTLLVALFSLHYLVARILVAGAIGMANYLFNLHLNFKVAGHHP